jgi:hypothetical protein
MNVQPQFPIFIPTLGRYEYGRRLTIRALEKMNIEQWWAVVEPQEYELYAEVVPPERLIVLDMSYKQTYRYCDSFGLTKSSGSGPARNFIWDKAIEMGAEWHWIMDDNIRTFLRLNNNEKHEMKTGACFRAMEDFCLRYANIGMAGPNYEMLVVRKQKHKPFNLNTRIYSCNLIRNDIPYRWRGRFNEDTILSLDMLKDGWCTVLFNACLQMKVMTQRVKGGNTDTIYKEGTGWKSYMLMREHPDVARVVKRWGRIHHYVDYSPFQKNALRRKPGIIVPEGINEFGMELRRQESQHG